MYPATHHALKAYASVGLETGVASASAHQLILMLFEGARLALASARLHMECGETAAKGEAISKAIMIIDNGLKASLDVKAGGELAEKLHALYDYMSARLLIANLTNDAPALDEVSALLAELNAAWEAIGKSRASVENRDPARPHGALGRGTV